MADTLETLKQALAGRYDLLEEIGRGGMATVYLADDLRHKRKVAVKVIRKDVGDTVQGTRFLREIELAAGLTHPNIVPVHDSGRAEGSLYYVMPYIDGDTLRHIIKQRGRLSLDEAVGIIDDVASALAYAHGRDVVHRDIKPENILFADSQAMVADFGIGKAIRSESSDNLTLDGNLMGTPRYMSPEQASGEPVDARTDVYSLGCVLYEMLVGTAPFLGRTFHETLAQHATKKVPSVTDHAPDLPDAINTVVRRAMAKASSDRYESVRQFANDLRQVADGTSPSGQYHIQRRKLKPRHTLVGALIVLLGIFGWFFRPQPTPSIDIRSLAVLPLSNLSGESEEMYFVDGMHGALITEISQISALSVISRTSVLKYRGTTESIPEIARELDVDAVLEGTVFRSGDSVRITARLVAGDPERTIFTLSYDRDIRDVLTLHAEVAQAVATAIEAELSPGEEQRLLTIHQIPPDVLDLFLRGKFEHAKATPTGFTAAIDYYEQVIDRAPSFAPAHSALALSVHMLGVYGAQPTSETEPRAKAAALRALELGGELAEARAVLGGVAAMYDWNWERAEQEYRSALEVDRSSSAARQWYAYHLSAMGRHDEAIAQARLGLQYDPLNPMGRLVLADQLILGRNYGQARAELEQVLQSDDSLDRARELLETIATLEGDYAEAVTVAAERIQRADLPNAAARTADLMRGFEENGPHGYWAWRLEQLERETTDRYVAPTEFAVVYTGLGDFDAAIEWLNRGYRHREGMEMLNVAPWYDPLRDDSRFQNLLERLDFPT